MKRDMDLIRKILFEMENCEEVFHPGRLSIEGYSDKVVNYHVYILNQAEFLTAKIDESTKDIETRPYNLSWKGHEFLDAVRDETVWNQVKSDIKKKSISVPMELLYKLCSQALTTIMSTGSI